MTLSLKNVIALAKAKNSIPCLQSVIFDGKSACTMANLEWMAGVPCAQSGLTEPVAVPVAAVLAHLAKSRHLFVMPDHLSNGQGLVTAFNPLECADVLEMLPKMPETDSVAFDLELNALDRVLVACGEHDIRYFLNGVMFDLTNGMLVGTDGHRLHAYKNRVPVVYPWDSDERKTKEKDIQYIVKRDPLHWMLKSAQDAAKVTIFDPVIDAADGEPSFLIQADDGFVWVPKAICGQYPDYQRVIPTQSSRSVWFEINPIHFSNALGAMTRAIQLACTTKFTGVVLDLEN